MQTDAGTAVATLGLALLVDVLAGEYPAAAHPVVWMGQLIAAGLRLAPASGWWRQFCYGAWLAMLLVAIGAGLTWLLLRVSLSQPWLEILVGAYFLKASFALRQLGRAALAVVQALEQENLMAARLALRSLCSRDPSALSQEEVLAATIESLAENASDSFVAPLFYYVLLGVPGAVGYRAINTLDAMVGYRGKFEALGKFSARLDDLANLVPARLTALLFLITGWILSGGAMRGWRILRRDGGKTPSPNGGRPMAVMAGLLNVQLAKKGIYSLGDPHETITTDKVRRAWRIVVASGVIMAVLCGLAVLALAEVQARNV